MSHSGAAYALKPPAAATSGVQYVATWGSDTSGDGLSWGSAVATAAQAITNLGGTTSGAGRVYVAGGQYVLTSTLTIPANIWLIGEGASPLAGSFPASHRTPPEYIWRGGDNTIAIDCTAGVGVDWSNGLVGNFRLFNDSAGGGMTSAGTGIRVMNPQNSSMLFNVIVGRISGTNNSATTYNFPTRSFWINNQAGGGNTGFTTFRDLWAWGAGGIGFDVDCGITSMDFDMCGVDTDDNTTVCFRVNANAASDFKCQVIVTGFKSEIKLKTTGATNNCDGIQMNALASYILTGCSILNGATDSTGVAYKYAANPATPAVPSVSIASCASLGLATWFSTTALSPGNYSIPVVSPGGIYSSSFTGSEKRQPVVNVPILAGGSNITWVQPAALTEFPGVAGGGNRCRVWQDLSQFTEARLVARVVNVAGAAAKVATGGAVTSGAAALTSTGGTAWAATDVGRVISVPGAGVAGATLVTTISAFTSGTAVTIATNASTTVSGQTVTTMAATLRLRTSGDDASFTTVDNVAQPAASGSASVDISALGTQKSTWVTISDIQLTDRVLQVIGVSGDGVVTPAFGNIVAEFR